MSYKEILDLSNTMQSVALLGENVNYLKKKKKKKGIIGLGVTNIVGTQLIKEQANIVKGI